MNSMGVNERDEGKSLGELLKTMSATKIAREKKQKTNFVIEIRDLQVIENLTLEQQGEVLCAIKDFVLHDKEPNLQTISGLSASFFIKTIEENNLKWLRTCEKNQENAFKRYLQGKQDNQS